ncbi:MAG: hypothetical protein DRI71_03025 [Bacteroidetes bacterium]|nr:MAG: hypothetical protein DRI71_03025 [Bacteroidota bacterium]
MKSNKGIKSLAASLMLFLAFNTGCYYDQVYIAPAEPPERDILFASDVEPIFYTAEKCTSCHSPSGFASFLDLSEGTAFNSINDPKYINTTTPAESLIYTKPDASEGHFKTYTADESAIVLKWIEQGAKNN